MCHHNCRSAYYQSCTVLWDVHIRNIQVDGMSCTTKNHIIFAARLYTSVCIYELLLSGHISVCIGVFFLFYQDIIGDHITKGSCRMYRYDCQLVVKAIETENFE